MCVKQKFIYQNILGNSSGSKNGIHWLEGSVIKNFDFTFPKPHVMTIQKNKGGLRLELLLHDFQFFYFLPHDRQYCKSHIFKVSQRCLLLSYLRAVNILRNHFWGSRQNIHTYVSMHIGTIGYIRVIWLLAIQPDIHGNIVIGYKAKYVWLYSHVNLALAIQPSVQGYMAKCHVTVPHWLYTTKEPQLLEKAYIACKVKRS